MSLKFMPSGLTQKWSSSSGIPCRDVAGDPFVESELSEQPEGGGEPLLAVPAFVLDVVERREIGGSDDRTAWLAPPTTGSVVGPPTGRCVGRPGEADGRHHQLARRRGGRELEVQPGQTAEDVGRHVLVAAGVRRAVVCLGDADARRAVEEPLDADPSPPCGRVTLPGQLWTPRPKARCSRASARSTRNSVGSSKWRGSRFAAPLSTISVAPAGMSTPATVVGRRASRKSPFTGASIRSVSSTKFGMSSRRSRRSLLQFRTLTDELQGGTEQPHRGLLPGGEDVGGDADDVDDLGQCRRWGRSWWPRR